MKTKSVMPSLTSIKCREAVLAAIQPFKNDLSGWEILAILSYTVGQVAALQDQRTVTREMIGKLIADNIEAGNTFVVEDLAKKSEGNA